MPSIQVPDCLSGGASQYGLLYGSTDPRALEKSAMGKRLLLKEGFKNRYN